MTKIKGKINSGLRKATETLKLQFPDLVKYLPEIETYHPATINVLLEQPIQILNPDIETPAISWYPNGHPEPFSFVSVQFELIGKIKHNPVDAHIYKPAFSPNYKNPFQIEMLTRKLDLKSSSDCYIHIKRYSRTVTMVII